MEEYTDEETGIRLTIEREPPYGGDWPNIQVHPPDGRMLTTEEANAAVRRLMRTAGYDEAPDGWIERKP